MSEVKAKASRYVCFVDTFADHVQYNFLLPLLLLSLLKKSQITKQIFKLRTGTLSESSEHIISHFSVRLLKFIY